MSSFTTYNPLGEGVRLDEAGRQIQAAEAARQATLGQDSARSHRWRDAALVKRTDKPKRGPDAAYEWLASRLVTTVSPARPYLRRAAAVLKLEPEVRDLTDTQLDERIAHFRGETRRNRRSREHTHQALAAVREAARRTLGLLAYPVQVAAALALLDRRMVEMATGEGKSLVAVLAAVLPGWRGRGCHIVTVNDYLAGRDAAWCEPLMQHCGLRVAAVVGESDPAQRRAGYAADVTYTTNKELAADYLRDRLTPPAPGSPSSGGAGRTPRSHVGRLAEQVGHLNGAGPMSGGGSASRAVMRGLAFAIIDEADSVLIDEAVTPLIIAGEGKPGQRAAAYRKATDLVRDLLPGEHFRLHPQHRDLTLTAAGRRAVDHAATTAGLTGSWTGRRWRHEMAHQALTAAHLFHRGDQYEVQDDQVVIVDEATGRLMPDRTWRAGLHQAVEAKEGLDPTPMKDTLARISFQRFFRMYDHLCGMTGTAWEPRAELWRTYRLRTVRMPTHRPCRRRRLPRRVLPTIDAKWDAVVHEAQRIHTTGRPILIGTRSVEASEQLAAKLSNAGLDHVVLNANRHAEEAAIVATAGEPGRITVATNMAGRGTDIRLSPEVAALGGLHVIATEHHDSARVDRQLFGRAARQGQPGAARLITSLDDPLLQRYLPTKLPLPRLRRLLPASAYHRAQHRATRLAMTRRRHVHLQDHQLDEQLGFAAD